MSLKFWEILVPYNDNDGKKFPLDHHKTWDSYVRTISGGLTIFKTSKGQWTYLDKVFEDKMIPIRIYCSEEQIEEIMRYTKTFYDQKAIFCCLISDQVKFLDENDEITT